MFDDRNNNNNNNRYIDDEGDDYEDDDEIDDENEFDENGENEVDDFPATGARFDTHHLIQVKIVYNWIKRCLLLNIVEHLVDKKMHYYYQWK